MAPEAPSSDALLRAGFVTLTRRALVFLRPVVEALADSPALQRQVIEYILRAYPDAQLEDLTGGLGAAGAGDMEGVVTTIADTLEARGRAEGEILGMVRGRQQDLTRLLQRRFGPLPAGSRDRISKAGTDQLDLWIDRVLDAGSLGEVFGDGPP